MGTIFHSASGPGPGPGLQRGKGILVVRRQTFVFSRGGGLRYGEELDVWGFGVVLVVCDGWAHVLIFVDCGDQVAVVVLVVHGC